MSNPARMLKEDKITVDKFALLMAEKRQAIQEIDDLTVKMDKAKDRIQAINEELQTLIGVRTEYDRPEVHRDLEVNPNHIPSKGIVPHIIIYLEAQEGPKTTEDIFQAVEAQMKSLDKQISITSVRAYLSNLNCFESIKKKDIKEGKTRHTKAGWILNQDALK